MKTTRLKLLAAAAAAACALAAQARADQSILHMPIGDPARKGREVAVTLDGITDTATGDLVSPAGMAKRLDGVGMLFIGENHTNQDFHDVQFRAIRALHDAGREVMIGLEMFPYTEQAVLDNWIAGRYTEDGFVELGRWYDNWGYHWNYYRNIFNYARENGIRMVAVNSPRELVKAVRSKGFDSLTPEEAAHLPPKLAPENEEHMALYRASFSKDDALHMNAQMLDGMYRAQTMWDATMGWNALQALKANGNPKAIMVVLIGAGHVTYGLGSPRQIAPWYDGKIAELVPVTVLDDEQKPVKKVRASYATFVWGVPGETDTLYPGLGASLMGPLGKDPSQVIAVSDKSIAERAGIKVGDVLLAIDGKTVGGDTRGLMSKYRWGDVVTVRLRRDGKEMDLEVPVRRAQ